MKITQLCSIFLCLLVVTTACSSRRLEYQQLPQDKPQPLLEVPQGATLGNALQLPNAQDNRYSYIPFDIDIIVPRPAAIFVQEKKTNHESVLLKEHLAQEPKLATLAIDSRFRPAIRTALPIEHVVKKLDSFLKNSAADYQSIDADTMNTAECVTMYKLNHTKGSMFICVQMTLDSVYIATHAEDADEKDLDEEGTQLLHKLTAFLL